MTRVESLFDLPAHVFFVHIPVVLTPVVCAGAVAVALRPSWRRRYGLLLVIAAAVVLVSTLLAFNSGQAFSDAIDFEEEIADHKSLAETTRIMVVGLFVVTLGLFLAGRRLDSSTDAQGGDARTGPVMAGLAGATVVLAVLSTVWVVRTGHEGALTTWEGVLPGTSPAVAVEPDPTTTTSTTTTTTTTTTTIAPTTTSAMSSTTTAPTTTTTTLAPAEVVDGAVVFSANCARCHGEDASGGIGPSLVANELTAGQIQAQIRAGGGRMPGFQEALTDPEIAAVTEFVEGL